jgi:hypothetical protein
MPISNKIIWKILSAGFFVSVTSLVLFFAYGYRYDFDEKVIQKTSIVDLKNKINNAVITFDGVVEDVELPYQIKNIVPGKYDLVVEKAGFKPWERVITVIEDRVSIVEDILLVPENIEDFIKLVYSFEKNQISYKGNNYLLLLIPGEKTMRILTLNRAGKVKDEEFQLFKPVLEVSRIYDNEKFVLKFEDGLYSYVDFPRKQFKIFTLPDSVNNYSINTENGTLFYLENKDLYKLKIDELAEEAYIKDIDAYAFDKYNNVKFIREGLLYEMNEGLEKLVFDEQPILYKNISIRDVNNGSVMILRDVNDQRYLYYFPYEGDLTLLSENVVGDVFYNEAGYVLFAYSEDQAFIFDIIVKELLYYFEMNEGDKLAGFYAFKYILIKNSNHQLEMIDLYNRNRHILLEDVINADLMQIGLSIYAIDKQQINVLYFEDKMRK